MNSILTAVYRSAAAPMVMTASLFWKIPMIPSAKIILITEKLPMKTRPKHVVKINPFFTRSYFLAW